LPSPSRGEGTATEMLAKRLPPPLRGRAGVGGKYKIGSG